MELKGMFRGSLLAVIAILAISGCQAIFTTSPLAFLQRDPDDLPLEQRIAWAQQALASGDEDKIEEAYKAIEDDADGSGDADLTLLAAQLALELSGVPDLAFEVIQGDIDFSGDAQAALDSFLASVDGEYVTAAGDFFQQTYANDPSALSGTDYLLGAGCLLFTAAGSGTVSALTAAEVADTIAFVDGGLATLSPDNPSYDYLQDLHDFLTNGAYFP